MKEIIRENKFSEVSYSKEHDLLEVVWKSKIVPSEEYRATWEATRKLVFKNFLSDGRQQGLVSPDDRKWFQSTIVKEAADKGLTTAAVVIADNPFKKYYMNMIFKVVKVSGVKMKIFTDYNKAKKWLLENKNS